MYLPSFFDITILSSWFLITFKFPIVTSSYTIRPTQLIDLVFIRYCKYCRITLYWLYILVADVVIRTSAFILVRCVTQCHSALMMMMRCCVTSSVRPPVAVRDSPLSARLYGATHSLLELGNVKGRFHI